MIDDSFFLLHYIPLGAGVVRVRRHSLSGGCMKKMFS